jgi:membrane-bound lytic murein transglycosylase A
LALEALTNAHGFARHAAAGCMIAAALSLVPLAASAARLQLPYPPLAWPFEISGSQYAPVAWSDIAGWGEDDHLQAYKAFRASCNPIAAQHTLPADP